MRSGRPFWNRSTRRLALVAALVVVGFAVAAFGVAGEPVNDPSDPRNSYDSGLAFGVRSRGDASKDCWRHHRVEGMVDSHVIIPIVPQSIEVGKRYPVGIQVINSWKYYVSALTVKVNIKENETYLRPLVGAVQDLPPDEFVWTGELVQERLAALRPDLDDKASVNFTVGKGAKAIRGELILTYPTNATTGDTFVAKWTGPGSGAPRDFDGNNADRHRNFSIPTRLSDRLVTPVDGAWKVDLQYTGLTSPTVLYRLNVTVEYEKAGAKNYTLVSIARAPPGNSPNPAKVIDAQKDLIIPEFEIEGLANGTQTLEFVAIADLYYKHQNPAIPNEDTYTRYWTLKVNVGNEFQPPLLSAAEVSGTLKVPFYLAAAEVTGFVGAFLLLPSLLLGGTYGRNSRKFFNSVLGGAKRRVMFHNLLSMGLTIVAILHVFFFLLEIRYTVLMGVLWGGLGALSLLALGLTGYYQVPLIQRYGYTWWRVVHLAFGLFVCVFVAYHAIADGAHFFFLKEQLPKWLQAANFAQS